MRRKARTFTRWCNVYLDSESERAIVASCFNHAGLQAEKPGEARLLVGRDGDVLGSETLAALARCEWEPKFDYRDEKKSDWPAYQASGERSMKAFERRWRRIRVAGANEHNITWTVKIILGGEYDLTMSVAVAPISDPARLQRAILFLHTQADAALEPDI